MPEVSADGQLDPGGSQIIANIPPIETRMHHEDLNAGDDQQKKADRHYQVGDSNPTGMLRWDWGGVFLQHGAKQNSGGEGKPAADAIVAAKDGAARELDRVPLGRCVGYAISTFAAAASQGNDDN
jgi:hypothetical protein